jgi:hypothetical protein
LSSSSGKIVRLKVAYRQPETLLTEYTKSIGRGGVRLEVPRPLPIGTKFVFEMHCEGSVEVVELEGLVVALNALADGRYLVNIKYETKSDRQALDATLQMIFQGARIDKKRQHARIPLVVRAVDERPNSPVFRVRDISVGGAGVEIEDARLPNYIAMGVPVLLQVKTKQGFMALHGEVSWCAQVKEPNLILPASIEVEINLQARFGIAFGHLPLEIQERVEKFVHLQQMPPPPWIAKIAFGDAALSAMQG